MVQDRAGYMLVCTEHGVFAYDGRRFVNLGTTQGLRQGGFVYNIALTSSGRVAVGFADEVLISDTPSDPARPPSSLTFHAAEHPGVTFFDQRVHRLASWHDGLVLLAGASTEKIVVPDNGTPRMEAMGYDLEEEATLKNARSVFSIKDQLWETFDDGRLCLADPGSVRCYGPADGLHGGPWHYMTAGQNGTILARSQAGVASLDAHSGRWTVIALPDQGGRYDDYGPYLGLFTSPDGRLITQAEHGLAVLGENGWHSLTVDDGAPPGIITSAMTDANGQFWFHVFGRGLVQWVGYGHWESVQKAEGLSDGIPWVTARLPGGSLWVTTDTGADEVVRQGAALRVARVLPGASFAIAAGPHGDLWRGYGQEGVRVTDPATGTETKIPAPPVNAIVTGPGEMVWLATQAGLYKVDDQQGASKRAVLQGTLTTPVVDLACDELGGVYYLSGGRLRHRRPDGTDDRVPGAWPSQSFQPLALAIGRHSDIWIGGAGGLYRFNMSPDGGVASTELMATAATRTNSIVAVMVDHRGWVWAGTSLGISVFNGERWVSADSDGGLVSDDVDQGGIREDPDGSIWVATTQGVSHLLDPAWLFANHPIKAVVSGATLGERPVVGDMMPYTEEALTVQFGAPSFGAERSFVFRYRLSDVDANWSESTSGLVRYPFVPPGRHLLTVIGYDELTHRSSPPASLVVDVAYPWWRQWWSETLWAATAGLLAIGAMRLQSRTILKRQADLKRRIAEATEQLRYQAAHDSLTGLFNRSEIERLLAAKLSRGPVIDEMIVALIDIDHFKRVNDNYGHLGGDDVLRAMGRLVSKAIGEGECAGRFGGEEILLVLDDSNGRGAERVLNLHHTIRGTPFNAAGKTIRVTCSIGLAWAVRGDDWESLIGRADDALYEAKASGRDQVVERGRSDPIIRGATN